LLAQARATAVASLAQPAKAANTNFAATWSANLRLYDAGELSAQSVSYEISRKRAIAAAAVNLKDARGRPVAPQTLARGRLWLTLTGPRGTQSMIEYAGVGLEVVGDVTAIRELTPEFLDQSIAAQKDYLLRQIEPIHKAFFKLYNAATDRAETRLRTTYTASGLWTLLLMNDHAPDPRIAALIAPMADFLLSMQAQDGAQKGAFHYAFEPAGKIRQQRFVVGTTSKTVFTLLELHRRTGEKRYLDAAVLAGQWLAARVRKDGRVVATTIWSPTKKRWVRFRRESILYTCETLSALSRLQLIQPQPLFHDAAERIAKRLLAKASASAFFVGDDYRKANNISTSWLTMSFLDFARVSDDPNYIAAVFTSAHVLSRRQVHDTGALDFGRYQDTWASSGNGWINEVMVEVVKRCRAMAREDCAIFEADLLRASRWLVQNTYRPENSFHIANPARASGGSIRDSVSEAVRTDAVSHGGNSLIGVRQLLGERARLRLPEGEF
jgi:hypothetical protein